MLRPCWQPCSLPSPVSMHCAWAACCWLPAQKCVLNKTWKPHLAPLAWLDQDCVLLCHWLGRCCGLPCCKCMCSDSYHVRLHRDQIISQSRLICFVLPSPASAWLQCVGRLYEHWSTCKSASMVNSPPLCGSTASPHPNPSLHTPGL